MIRISNLFLGLLLLPAFSQAQSFRLIQPGKTYLFGHENLAAGRTQFDHAIRIDSSTVAGSDTLRYNYRIAEKLSAGPCLYSFSDTSWLGNHFIESPGNSFTFFNQHQDSIFFHADSLGSWRMMALGGGLEVRATYSGTSLEMANGSMADSVRRFEIQVFDSLSMPVAHPLNGKVFKASKQLGLVQTLSFWEMPDTLPGHSATLNLEDSATVTNGQLWDLRPGDSLHVYQLKRNVQEKEETYWEYVVLTRNMNPSQDTLSLELSYRYIRHYDDWTLPVVITSQIGTIQHSIRISPQNQPWDQLPYACPDVMGAQLADPQAVPALFRSQEYGGRLVKTHYQAIWPGIYEFDTLNNCFPEPGSQGFLPFRLFGVEGLGGDYYRDTFPSSISALERYPVWFRKGGETWGTPWDFDGLMNGVAEEIASRARIYPQPLETEAWVDFGGTTTGTTLEIWDLQGRMVREMKLESSGRTLLSREDFPGGGLYLYRGMNADGIVVARGKILVK